MVLQAHHGVSIDQDLVSSNEDLMFKDQTVSIGKNQTEQLSLLQGFGQYYQNNINIQSDITKSAKKKKTSLISESDYYDNIEQRPDTRCFSCFFFKSNQQSLNTTTVSQKQIYLKKDIEWTNVTYLKINEIFRINNQNCVPEWLQGFQNEFNKHIQKIQESGYQFKKQFRNLVNQYQNRKVSKSQFFADQNPKVSQGTIKKYLTNLQQKILELLNKQLVKKKNGHPILIICQLFRQEFGKVYYKYYKLQKNKDGTINKAEIIRNIKIRNDELQSDFLKQNSDLNFFEKQDDEKQNFQIQDSQIDKQELEEINLTNQLIGEVQGFIYVMRWLVYEFYEFKELGLMKEDFEAIEDDVLYIIHTNIVCKEIYQSLLVLTRLLHNHGDKLIRDQYKAINQFKSKYFPIQQKLCISSIQQDENDLRYIQNPLFDQIVEMCNHKKTLPFQNSIDYFKKVMESEDYSPLEKLQKLIYLPIMDYLEKHKKEIQCQRIILTQDENIQILIYIILQAKVPDLASQIELITVFASEYMQQSQDGCQTSQTYLSLVACSKFIQELEIDFKKGRQETLNSIEYEDIGVYNESPATSLSKFSQRKSIASNKTNSSPFQQMNLYMQNALKMQKLQEQRILKLQQNQRKQKNIQKKDQKQNISINQDSDEEEQDEYSQQSFFKDQNSKSHTKSFVSQDEYNSSEVSFDLFQLKNHKHTDFYNEYENKQSNQNRVIQNLQVPLHGQKHSFDIVNLKDDFRSQSQFVLNQKETMKDSTYSSHLHRSISSSLTGSAFIQNETNLQFLQVNNLAPWKQNV